MKAPRPPRPDKVVIRPQGERPMNANQFTQGV